MQVQDLKVGDQFKMNGLSVSGKPVKVKCELIKKQEMNKCIIYCQGINILVDSTSEIFI